MSHVTSKKKRSGGFGGGQGNKRARGEKKKEKRKKGGVSVEPLFFLFLFCCAFAGVLTAQGPSPDRCSRVGIEGVGPVWVLFFSPLRQL